ncbi:MAG: hypothetical protein GXY19_22160 [Phycisphaerae bacterium]|nr:hypothetical protein [Phycisphaerae bacterium]
MNLYLTELVRYLAAQSWQIAVLTLVVAGATWALRHKTAHIRYLLWLIVLAKCLVPPFFAVPLRVLPEKTASHTVVETPAVDAGSSVPIGSGLPSVPGPKVESSQAEPTVPLTRADYHPSEPADLRVWAAMVWIAGAGLYLAMNLLRALRGRYWLHARRRPLPDAIRKETETLLSIPGRRPVPPIWVIDEIGQPFVWGLLRGSIYVPSHFLKIGDRTHRRHVLAHELSHVLRCDAAVNALQTLAQGLFWFHPLVWWANREIRREREKCCDEMAVAQLGTEPREYCHAVVETLASAETSARPVPSLAVAGPARNLEERIKTMLKPGRQFYRRPSGPAALVVLLTAILIVPTAVVLTVRARAEGQTSERKATFEEVVAAYEASRNAAPRRYLMVVKNNSDVYVTYQNEVQLYRAKYAFGSPRAGQNVDMQAVANDQTNAGETIRSILAWAQQHTPQNVEVHDGTYTCSLWPDGYGHFEGGQKTASPPDEMFLPTLGGRGWPLLGGAKSKLRLISTDRYALDHSLICIEEQHEAIRDGREKVTLTTRFYLNPERDYLCRRRLEPHNDYAEEITEYARTDQGQWYPLQISEFGYKHMRKPMTSEPSRINAVYLDLDPTFPDDIFSPDALLARYADLLVPPQPETPSTGVKPEDDSAVRVAGRVLAGDTREPIPDALIRVAVPAVDMRDARGPSRQVTQEDGTTSDIYETRTNSEGRFEMIVPAKEGNESFSVDAWAPGFGTAAGTGYGGGNNPNLEWLPLTGASESESSNLTILLTRAIYVAGTVTAPQRVPLPGVKVAGYIYTDSGTAWVSSTETDERGRFEIFDFPLEQQAGGRAELSFTSPKALPERRSGLYDLPAEQRRSLRVVLMPGRRITGVVQDANGRPTAGVTVQAIQERILRDATTDSDGRFELAGLPEVGTLTLRAFAGEIDQKAVALAPFVNRARDDEMTLRMTRIELKSPLEPVTLFGMQLVDVTAELETAYDLFPYGFSTDGVMILAPGVDHRRLQIGDLKKTYCFHVIEEQRVANVREMIAELLGQITRHPTYRQGDTPSPIRVVYTIPNGVSTQYLELTPADVAELRQLADQLGIAVASNNR